MGKRVEHLTAWDAANLVRLNQDLEELNRSVDNGRVAESAAISTKKLNIVDMGEMTVGTSETIVRHNLGAVPYFLILTMRTSGTVWESSRATTTKAFLTASAADRKVHVLVCG